MAAVQAGATKEEARDIYDCVIGVKDASFSVRRGEIFCIMGLSGSGKSTLLRHVNGLIQPTAGEVRVGGKSVTDLPVNELRELRAREIGMVFQHMALWPHRTVVDNVAYGLEIRGVAKKERRAAAVTALETMALTGWETHYPDQLSGGMRQRVGLARAICADPAILLMDEPFSALDPLIRRQLQDQFLELARVMNKTTLFVTHDLDEAIRIGDRIAIMNDGEIVQIGTPEQIATEPKDDYVADFVEGISRLHLVRARSIMEPLDSGTGGVNDGPPAGGDRADGALSDLPRVDAEADLDAVIAVAAAADSSVLVVDDDEPVGVISRHGLLSAIRG